MRKKYSLDDIAKMLGVSKTLVSMVINNKGDEYGINPKTQQKVRDKIKELEYQPNPLARSFRTGNSNTLGLIVSDISNRFYARIARDLEDRAARQGYQLIICSTDEIVEKEQELIQMLLDRRVDGLIISSSQDNAVTFNKLMDEKIPHVLIDRIFPEMRSPSVCVDNFQGARLATRHLITQGFQRIGILAITPDHISSVQSRIQGYRKAMEENALPIQENWIMKVEFGNLDISLYQKLQRLQQDDQLPEAIFTLNNNLTSACLQALKNLSLNIPSDIALIGFDDVSYYNFTQPTISVVKQPIEKISEHAFDLLLGQIKKNKATSGEKNLCLPVELVIRESSIKTPHGA